ncbi:MAG: LPS export ABC transporter permease LptF [Deltaproteobacteria bacterium]|nr:LPS export ABC transporter permease LptF [Deltaproteobacteria bacterium]
MKTTSRTPLLLYSYLATEMLAPFFASFIIMNCVFFLVKLIPFLNFTLNLSIGAADFIRLFAYLFPSIFLYSIPMAAMMGITIAFARLSSDSEILAFKASGISIYRILPPVIIVATLIALLTGYFSIKLIPLSEVSMKHLIFQLLNEKINKGIKERTFTEALGDVVVYVNKIDRTSGQWSDVWVSDMRGVSNPVITMASSGQMTSDLKDMMVSIELRNGSLHRPSRHNAQIIQFDEYMINIPLRLQNSRATRLKRSALTMSQLRKEASSIEENSEHKRKLLIEYQKRLVLPFGCLMISLIGLPLGLQARPGKKAIGIQAGLVIFVLYYILFTFGKTLAEEGTLPIIPAMWAPNTLFLLLTIFWIIRVADEKPLIPEFITFFLKDKTAGIRQSFRNMYSSIINKIKGTKPIEEPLDDLLVSSAAEAAIRGNVISRVFHLPECEFYDCKNCTIEFKNIQIALDVGFEPCHFCKNLIDK